MKINCKSYAVCGNIPEWGCVHREGEGVIESQKIVLAILRNKVYLPIVGARGCNHRKNGNPVRENGNIWMHNETNVNDDEVFDYTAGM